MATVTPRRWKMPSGETRRAWLLTYHDADGKRHRKQFRTKRAAEDERIRIEGQLAAGVHVPDRDSATVRDAARAFLADFEGLVAAGKRDRTTLRMYGQHADLHIAAFDIAGVRLSRLSGPDCAGFARDLEANRSDAMAMRVFSTFRMIVDWAIGAGLCTGNPARAVKIRTAGARFDDGGEVRIPPKKQLRALWQTAKAMETGDRGKALAFLAATMFGGLRMSELRGLAKPGVQLGRAGHGGRLQVTQRADRWQTLGPTKTRNSRRTVPVPAEAAAALRRWLVARPNGDPDLVFPTGAGTVESYANLYRRLWVPLMVAAGLAEDRGDREMEPLPRFSPHGLRHVACSLWIEKGATPKQVMTWAGHASIQFTMDTYGHLWEDIAGDAAIVGAAGRDIAG